MRKGSKSKTFDPFCMLALAVIDRMAKDKRDGDARALLWFESDDYQFYLDFIS